MGSIEQLRSAASPTTSVRGLCFIRRASTITRKSSETVTRTGIRVAPIISTARSSLPSKPCRRRAFRRRKRAQTTWPGEKPKKTCRVASQTNTQTKVRNENNHLDGNVAHRCLDSDLQKCLDFPGLNSLGFGRGWTHGAPGRRYCCRGCCFAQYRGTFGKKGRESGRWVSLRTN